MAATLHLLESVVRLAGGVAGRLGDLQVGGRSHLLVVSPHSPDVEELALLDNDQTEDQQHDAAHHGEETDEDSLYDGLVEVTCLLAGPRADVVVGTGQLAFR